MLDSAKDALHRRQGRIALVSWGCSCRVSTQAKKGFEVQQKHSCLKTVLFLLVPSLIPPWGTAA